VTRLTFALDCVGKMVSGQDKNCPYCGSAQTRLLARKKLLAHLRHCNDCGLMFLWPKPEAVANKRFYQSAYRESAVTDLPSPAALAELVAAGFRGGPLDYGSRITAVRRLRLGGSLLDYGASWGYGVWQFKDAGYEAAGFEVSRARAAFGGQRLGVQIATDVCELMPASFDIIHTAHVLEHLADLRATFADFRRLLRPGGHLVIFVPNGNGRSARALGVKWGPMIGEKHVNALTAAFLVRALTQYGFACALGPEDADELELTGQLSA
jgi:SAM-dependent methyltransferase